MATRALMSGVRHIRGCPRPAPAPPPSPAPPALPSLPMGVLTDTGTARNGPALYPGLYVNSQGVAGAITVRNGPDANYPVVQHIPTPTTGAWHYADGVDPADESTWPRVQSLWAIFAGTTQNVSFYCKDFTDSPFPATTQAAELSRITTLYTAGTLWWKAKGAASGDGSGSSEANAINGSRALQTKLASGVADWTRVRFSFVNGACTIASEGSDWPHTGAESARLPSGSARNDGTTNPAGIIFGSSMVATSNASRIWFDFGDGSQMAFDMRGATNTNRRMWAGVRFMGEQIVVTGIWVRPPDWFYICHPTTGATRISGPFGNAEDASFENNGIIIFGNGNHIHNWRVEGNKVASVYGLVYAAAEESVSDATAGLRGSVSYGHVSGVLTGIQVRAFGATGYDLEVPSGIDVFENLVDDPGWGHSTILDLSSAGSGNSAVHGNGFAIQGKWFGACHVYRNTVTGGFQDGIGGVGTGVVVSDNYIHTLNLTTTATFWYWNTAPATDVWAIQTDSANTEGNGIKSGHLDKDLRSPTLWLGTDGDPMTDTIKGDVDHLGVDEVRWIILRNIIHNVQGCGITNNDANGGFVAFNEILDSRGAGIILIGLDKTAAKAKESNWYYTNNIVKKTVTGPGSSSGACLRLETSVNHSSRIWMHNNILWAGASQTEIFVEGGGGGITFSANTKNVLVRGSVSGTYSQTGNLTDATSKADAQLYVFSTNGDKTLAGLPVGNSLRTAGSATPQTHARTHGCYLDFRGDQLHESTPCVGPCNAP